MPDACHLAPGAVGGCAPAVRAGGEQGPPLPLRLPRRDQAPLQQVGQGQCTLAKHRQGNPAGRYVYWAAVGLRLA